MSESGFLYTKGNHNVMTETILMKLLEVMNYLRRHGYSICFRVPFPEMTKQTIALETENWHHPARFPWLCFQTAIQAYSGYLAFTAVPIYRA